MYTHGTAGDDDGVVAIVELVHAGGDGDQRRRPCMCFIWRCFRTTLGATCACACTCIKYALVVTLLGLFLGSFAYASNAMAVRLWGSSLLPNVLNVTYLRTTGVENVRAAASAYVAGARARAQARATVLAAPDAERRGVPDHLLRKPAPRRRHVVSLGDVMAAAGAGSDDDARDAGGDDIIDDGGGKSPPRARAEL
jgi:hypothetical protein